MTDSATVFDPETLSSEDQYLLRRLREAQNAFHTLEFDALKRLSGYETMEAVRSVFKNYYQDLGWKRLCQIYVFRYGADALFLHEMERRAKRGGTN